MSNEPPILPEQRTHNCMSSALKRGRYVVLYWPKDASLRELEYCEEAVHFQLAGFIEAARRKESADIEYASWFAPPSYDPWFAIDRACHAPKD